MFWLKPWALFALLALLAATVPVCGATFRLYRSSPLVCATGQHQAYVTLFNESASAQTVPGGTTVTLAFSAPVVNAPAWAFPSGAVITQNGNVVSVKLASDLVVASQTLLFWSVYLDVSKLASGSLLTVSITSDPANAFQFPTSGPDTFIGLIDSTACQQPAAGTLTALELTAVCPTAQEVAELHAAVNMSFETDPGPLVCKASEGSADLTRLQERAYQALRLMRAVPFDLPVPWTPKTLWDWFTSVDKGVRFRKDIDFSYCCDPDGVINLQAKNLSVIESLAPDALASLMVLMLHEARHIEIGGHTCGTNDQTLSELGAWGAQYYADEWLVHHTGSFFGSRSGLGGASAYRTPMQLDSDSMIRWNFCDLEGGVTASPRNIDFGTIPANSTSGARTVAVTLTRGQGSAITSVALSGTDVSDFDLSSNTCSGAIPYPSCTALLRFVPQAAGARSAQLNIVYGTPAVTISVALSGTGGAATACISTLAAHGQVLQGTGGSGSVALSGPSSCTWNATSNSTWITGVSAQTDRIGATVTYNVAPNAQGTAREGTLTIAGQTFTVSQAGASTAVRPNFIAEGVTNGASFNAGASAGGIVTIFGTHISGGASGIVSGGVLPLPTVLSDVTVLVSGYTTPIFAVANVNGQEQINLQIPLEMVYYNSADIVVNNAGVLSDAVTVPLYPADPGVFTVDGTAGTILHSDNTSLVTAAKPAQKGEVMVIFATGLGEVDNAPATGAPAPSVEPLARVKTVPSVTIGGVPAGDIKYAGLAPYFVGLYQVNVAVPAGSPSGSVAVVLSSQGRSSKPATLFVQ